MIKNINKYNKTFNKKIVALCVRERGGRERQREIEKEIYIVFIITRSKYFHIYEPLTFTVLDDVSSCSCSTHT